MEFIKQWGVWRLWDRGEGEELEKHGMIRRYRLERRSKSGSWRPIRKMDWTELEDFLQSMSENPCCISSKPPSTETVPIRRLCIGGKS